MIEKVNKNNLKVGDTVYVAKPYDMDWATTFRYPFYQKETITRITPKRTKFVTNNAEYDKCTAFYAYSEEMEQQQRIALIAKKVAALLPQLNGISINYLKDEQLEALLPLLEQVVEVIGKKK